MRSGVFTLIVSGEPDLSTFNTLWYSPGVKQPSISIVGTGRLGKALAQRFSESGYEVSKIRSRRPEYREFRTDVVWFCVPDAQISRVADQVADQQWRGKCVFHASGVLTSEVLEPLRRGGADVATVHPLMTFVSGAVPELAGVPFAVEGDVKAVRVARQIVSDLGGRAFAINKRDKVAYHAFATMICPLLVSLLAAAEKTAKLAGITEGEARRRMMPIIRQTVRNYEKLGPSGAFSGPIVRGDLETVRSHLEALKVRPMAQMVYKALAEAALKYLPSGNRDDLAALLKQASADCA